jgi:DNA-binding MarR family transcriptional regulator
MTERNVYQELAEAIGAGESRLMPRIFETLADENEAQVLLAAAPPATVDEIAEKTGLPNKDIEKMLDPLFMKGLIFKSRKPGDTRYYRVRHVVQFHDATALAPNVSRDTLDLWKEYMDTEWQEDLQRFEAALPQPVVRVVPVNVTIESKTQVLAFDAVKSIVENAKNLALTGVLGTPLE